MFITVRQLSVYSSACCVPILVLHKNIRIHPETSWHFAGNLFHYSFYTFNISTSCYYYFISLSEPRVFDKVLLCTKLAQCCMPTVVQSTMMGQLRSISIEGLKHVAPKWSNGSSKVSVIMEPIVHHSGLLNTLFIVIAKICYDHGCTASTGHEMPCRQVH